MKRPSWDEYFMKIAEDIALRSTCLRRSVGAVLVKGERILATGYNGAPKNIIHCMERGCLREERNIPSGTQSELCIGIHAEQNAVIQAAFYGVSVEGATLYCTHQPCVLCSKILINVGIKRIVYKEPYFDQLALQLLEEANVKIEKF